MKIVMHDPLPLDEHLAAVQDAAPSAEIVVASKENVAEELRDAEIFFGFHSPEVLASLNHPHISIIHGLEQ